MKNRLIFGFIAAIGALVLYLLDKEALAVGFIALVWGVYERFNGLDKVKKKDTEIEQLRSDFKEAVGTDVETFKRNNR